MEPEKSEKKIFTDQVPFANFHGKIAK